MMLLWLPIGCLLPTLSGWLLLRLLEGRHAVLSQWERWVFGFVLGLTFTIFVTFVLHVTHLIALTRNGLLAVQVFLTFFLTCIYLLRRRFLPHPKPHPLPSHPRPTPIWLTLLLVLAVLWTIVKIAAGGAILATTPPYLDDTLKNWNLRGKAFFLTHELTLDLGDSTSAGVSPLSSYPPTVSLLKTWLASLAGEWDEGLVNSIHLLWFLASLALLYMMVRRFASRGWALAGVYLLASLPLYLFHGVNAYADVFVSAHLFAAMGLLFLATTLQGPERASAFRLGALASALLIFTKNEALLLHLPAIGIALLCACSLLILSGRMTRREAVTTLLWYGGSLFIIALPWLLFKWVNGLPFGNAKAVSTGYVLGWQPLALGAIWTNTFFEGNWLLLFPLFLLLIATQGKRILEHGPYVILTLFLLIVIGMQLALFLFTSLSVEAAYQTGLARGFVQLAPLIVLLTVLLARDAIREE
jgi:hypothetical protein